MCFFRKWLCTDSQIKTIKHIFVVWPKSSKAHVHTVCALKHFIYIYTQGSN